MTKLFIFQETQPFSFMDVFIIILVTVGIIGVLLIIFGFMKNEKIIIKVNITLKCTVQIAVYL